MADTDAEYSLLERARGILRAWDALEKTGDDPIYRCCEGDQQYDEYHALKRAIEAMREVAWYHVVRCPSCLDYVQVSPDASLPEQCPACGVLWQGGIVLKIMTRWAAEPDGSGRDHGGVV